MTKNTVVIDELGNVIGRTYAKRAKGLVKNGRAEYVDDCTIRMLHTSASTDTELFETEFLSEEQKMSNVINFDAREFKFDKSFQEKKIGSRMFITDVFGESTEVYQIGDGSDEAVRLYNVVSVEKFEEYVFRFSMTRECEAEKGGVSEVWIIPFAGETVTEDDIEEGYIFNLAMNQYKPVLSKNWEEAELKLYEIPFRSLGAEKVCIYIVEKEGVAKIIPGKEAAAYDSIQDFSYIGWLSEKKDQIGSKIKESIPKDFNVEQTVKGAKESVKHVGASVGASVVSAVGKISDFVITTAEGVQKNFQEGNKEGEEVKEQEGPTQCIHRGDNMTAEELAILLQNVPNESVVDFSNCDIRENDYLVDGGEAVSGSSFITKYANLSGQAFITLVRKMGDGCKGDFSFSNIESVRSLDAEGTIIPRDGNNVILNNCNISVSAFALLMSAVGDGCLVEVTGANIYEDGSDFSFGKAVDGTTFHFEHVNMSENVANNLHSKIGVACNIIGL